MSDKKTEQKKEPDFRMKKCDKKSCKVVNLFIAKSELGEGLR